MANRLALFDLDRDAALLMGGQPEDASKRFLFQKEIALFLFRTWILWPDKLAKHRSAARLIAAVVTTHRKDAAGKIIAGRLKKLVPLRDRLHKPWYEEFDRNFYSKVGGLQSSIDTYTVKTFDRAVQNRELQLEIPIDMLDFMVRIVKYNPALATRNVAEEFIARNGFERRDNYGVRIGVKKKEKEKDTPYSIAKPTVQKRWDKAPVTLGLAYVISRSWPELWSLSAAKRDFMPQIVELATKDDLARLMARYNWLLKFCKSHLPQIVKHQSWPSLTNFPDCEAIPTESLTNEQLTVVREIRPKAHLQS